MSNYVILLGSLRKQSTNRQLAEAFIHHLPEDDTATVFEQLRDVPFYDEDTDVPGQEPKAAAELRAAVRDADGLVIITPEHNHTAPAVITNAIDWCSRPMGSGVLMGKPSLVMGFTPSPRALAGATAVLREALVTVQAKCVATDYTWGDAYTLLDGRHPKDVDEVVGILHKAQAELGAIADATPDKVDPRAGGGIGAE
ncbi:NAD(P)H-dependent oxidoreductase [uncultured Corynebacterium sp.]|uniref:NAD(P)H-dependent oxidoreductase n=1 Tax=uncultured Corynebacterium sp. TaxID=159447 RepID=UPI0025DF08B9|nr:NAD(P)H-dependent oxidoreductase [uncultured Corynebacterium sp.]